MPQRQKVPSLQSLTLRNVGFTVERIANEIATNVQVEEYVQQTRDYLNKLMTCVPFFLYDHIAVEVLEGVRHVVLDKSLSVKKMNSLGRINETVLIPQLKFLNIFLFSRGVTREFYPNMQNLTGLEKLELSSLPAGFGTPDFYNYLSESISAMKKLKSFSFKYTCTDGILQVIGNHCPDIQYLDFDSSYSVTDRSIPHLLNCKNLTILTIGGSPITIDGMAKIILGLPNLLEVDYERFDLVVEYLNNLGCGPFGLRKVQSLIYLKDLNSFLDMFPKTEYIVFFRSICNLPILPSLVNFKTLIVRDCEIHNENLTQLLKVKGGNITSLFMDFVEGIAIQHIIDIGLYCPNLECLGLIMCEFTGNPIPSGRFDRPIFKNLRKVFYAENFDMGILEFVLSNALNIQVIDVTYEPGIRGISHSFVENVLSVNPMTNLEEFSVLNSRQLNMRTVEILLESCANLKVLSNLEGWRGIRREELKSFKEYIASHNFDLEYVCSPQPKEWIFK